MNRQQSKSAFGDFLVNIIPVTVNILIFHAMIKEMKADKLAVTCGIPIVKYVDFAHGVMAMRAITLLIKVWVIRNYFTKRLHFELVRLMTFDLATMICLIYGQILLFSKENDCSKTQSTALLEHVMTCSIIFGAFMICFYFVKECPVLCLQALLQNYLEPIPRRRDRSALQAGRRAALNELSAEEQAANIEMLLSNLPKQESFDGDKFDHERNCVICLAEYRDSDTITQLKCDSRHYFHTSCLETWVKNNNNSCPVCRVVIVK